MDETNAIFTCCNELMKKTTPEQNKNVYTCLKCGKTKRSEIMTITLTPKKKVTAKKKAK